MTLHIFLVSPTVVCHLVAVVGLKAPMTKRFLNSVSEEPTRSTSIFMNSIICLMMDEKEQKNLNTAAQ